MTNTRAWSFLAAAGLLIAPACKHATDVASGRPPDDREAGAVPEPDAQRQSERPSSQARSPAQGQRPSTEGVPLPTSAQGLLRPGAAREIKHALEAKGYLRGAVDVDLLDADATAALRKFQGDQDLAKTGAPDHATIEKLGLRPDEIFKARTDEREVKVEK
jgi:hypothetical protein